MQANTNSDPVTLAEIPESCVPVRISQSVILAAPAEAVFAVVSDHARLCELIPDLHQAHMDLSQSGGKEGVGMVRCCDFGNDMWIQETVVHWEPPFVYAYRITAPNPFGLTDHFAVVNCHPIEAGTQLTWQQHYHHADLDAMNAKTASMMDALLMNLSHRFQP